MQGACVDPDRCMAAGAQIARRKRFRCGCAARYGAVVGPRSSAAVVCPARDAVPRDGAASACAAHRMRCESVEPVIGDRRPFSENRVFAACFSAPNKMIRIRAVHTVLRRSRRPNAKANRECMEFPENRGYKHKNASSVFCPELRLLFRYRRNQQDLNCSPVAYNSPDFTCNIIIT